MDGTISGDTINLVSNDAQAIEQLGYPVFLCSFALLDIVVSLGIVWYLVAWQALIGACFFLMIFFYGSVVARKAGTIRKKAATQTDKRLEIMREIVAGIRVVKMYAWEWNFRDMVSQIRTSVSTILYPSYIITSGSLSVKRSRVKGQKTFIFLGYILR